MSKEMGGFTLGAQDDGSILFDGIAKWDEVDFALDEPVTIYHLFKLATAKDVAILKIKEQPFF